MLSAPSILLAACDATLAGIFGRKFEREGWDVDVAENVRDAEHRAVQMRPSVLLFDASCTTDVPAEIRRLLALPTMQHTKIVVLADVAHRAQIDAALRAGASDFLLVGHFVPIEAVEKMKRLIRA